MSWTGTTRRPGTRSDSSFRSYATGPTVCSRSARRPRRSSRRSGSRPVAAGRIRVPTRRCPPADADGSRSTSAANRQSRGAQPPVGRRGPDRGRTSFHRAGPVRGGGRSGRGGRGGPARDARRGRRPGTGRRDHGRQRRLGVQRLRVVGPGPGRGGRRRSLSSRSTAAVRCGDVTVRLDPATDERRTRLGLTVQPGVVVAETRSGHAGGVRRAGPGRRDRRGQRDTRPDRSSNSGTRSTDGPAASSCCGSAAAARPTKLPGSGEGSGSRPSRPLALLGRALGRRARLNAVLTSPMCENACGKLPTSRLGDGVVLLGQQADVVAQPEQPLEQLAGPRRAGPCRA